MVQTTIKKHEIMTFGKKTIASLQIQLQCTPVVIKVQEQYSGRLLVLTPLSIKGSKVRQENILRTITPPAARTVDVREDGRMMQGFHSVFAKF